MHPLPLRANTLPVLITTEHLLPQITRPISGKGEAFTQLILDAMRAGGLWIVMQDSNGDIANQAGDIVTLGTVADVDWLSGDQIQVCLDASLWGVVDGSQTRRSARSLTACPQPLWHCEQQLAPTDRLVTQLREYADQHGAIVQIGNNASLDPCWLCWRWLEILPLPVQTKQRLLKQPGPNACLRYLKRIIRQSDLYAELLR